MAQTQDPWITSQTLYHWATRDPASIMKGQSHSDFHHTETFQLILVWMITRHLGSSNL